MSRGGHFSFHYKSAVVGSLNEEGRSDAQRVEGGRWRWREWDEVRGEPGTGGRGREEGRKGSRGVDIYAFLLGPGQLCCMGTKKSS